LLGKDQKWCSSKMISSLPQLFSTQTLSLSEGERTYIGYKLAIMYKSRTRLANEAGPTASKCLSDGVPNLCLACQCRALGEIICPCKGSISFRRKKIDMIYPPTRFSSDLVCLHLDSIFTKCQFYPESAFSEVEKPTLLISHTPPSHTLSSYRQLVYATFLY
jgi:hypothetical protein